MKLEFALVERYGIFMTIDDLADLIKIKKASIYQQLYQGKLHIPHVKQGKRYLFQSAVVGKYLEDQIS
ncbi:helix-turn-helix domain-containing protein [Pseudomonadales bacterium]|nr:helix-turn-helix domain-containing protein [Pseudomonadales bacterium]